MDRARSRSLALSAALVITLGVGSAHADLVAVDFDTDGDPSTIENEISAEVGDLVQGFVALDYIPSDYNYIHGIQFGIGSSSGLELVGLYPAGAGGGFLTDGPTAIALALSSPIAHEDLPVFLASVVFEVTSLETQVVEVTPSNGWGVQDTEIRFAVSYDGSFMYEVFDARMMAAQTRGYVNRGETPIEATSWGAIKKLYTDEGL